MRHTTFTRFDVRLHKARQTAQGRCVTVGDRTEIARSSEPNFTLAAKHIRRQEAVADVVRAEVPLVLLAIHRIVQTKVPS